MLMLRRSVLPRITGMLTLSFSVMFNTSPTGNPQLPVGSAGNSALTPLVAIDSSAYSCVPPFFDR